MVEDTPSARNPLTRLHSEVAKGMLSVAQDLKAKMLVFM